jgi:enterobacterial common antigen flippase
MSEKGSALAWHAGNVAALPSDPAPNSTATSTAAAAATATATTAQSSYHDILKSSALMGGSAAINVLIGMVRTKAMAALLGPAGFGLLGAFTLLSELVRNVAQMGLAASGVRQIADAVGSGDDLRVARTALILQRVSWGCALLGALLLVIFAAPLSSLTFGNVGQAGAIALLSVGVFFSVVAGAQGALLQGMRRIADIAKLGVLGGVLGTLTAVPLVYFWGERGLVPSLVLVAACSLLTTWWFYRKVALLPTQMRIGEVWRESSDLLRLGLAFMASSLLMTLASYVVRIIVLRDGGLEAAGIYQAAWTLGGLYVTFVLQALGTDFYPRLVAVIEDEDESNRLVNEQAHVNLLLATPGILITLTAAPLALHLFYTAQFMPAVEVLRWMCLGMALRVLTWPIGYIIVAKKDRQMLFFATELAWAIVNVALTWFCVQAIGTPGAGLAFLLSYVFHGFMIYGIVRRLTGFRWSPGNVRLAAGSFGVIALVFVALHALPPLLGTAWAVLCCGAAVWFCAHKLARLVAPQRLPRWLRPLLQTKVVA